jgi:hypothetical protein
MTTTLLRLTDHRGETQVFQVTKKRKNSKKFETVTPVSFREEVKVVKTFADYRRSDTNEVFGVQTSRRVYDFHVGNYNRDVERFCAEYSWELHRKEYDEVERGTSEIEFTYDKTLMMEYDKEDREIFEEFKKELNPDAKCDSWKEFMSIVSCELDSLHEKHYRKFVKPEEVEVRQDEGKIFIKKGMYRIAHVDIIATFWSDLEVLGKMLSKHSVEEVANIVNGLEHPYALEFVE